MKQIRDKSVELAAAAAALLLCLLSGNGWFSNWLLASLGPLNLLSALGVPAGLPNARGWPLGETTWWQTITETFAAGVFVAMVALWINGTRKRRLAPGAPRLFLGGWVATIVAAVAADLVRMTIASFATVPSPGIYLGLAIAAIVFGSVWGLVTGWIVGAAVLVAARYDRRRETSTPVVET
ncbi:MAG: hypothetical protein ACRD0P_01130 [Stackebrandtia sp.]